MKTKQTADLYGLTGWVRNLPDGRLDGIISGDERKLNDFIKWLHQGPELARVLKVEIEVLENQVFEDFHIL